MKEKIVGRNVEKIAEKEKMWKLGNYKIRNEKSKKKGPK